MTNKEIEEMAKVIEETWLVDLEGNTFCVNEFLDEVDIKSVARELYNAGYLNVKDKVVLNNEDYDKLCHLAYFGYDDAYEKGCRETAEKILNFVADHYSSDFLISELDEYITEQLGFEI